MSDCSKHKKEVEGYNGSIKDLARDVADLHYESLSEFLLELGFCLNEDARADEGRGRPKLASNLKEGAQHITRGHLNIEKAWEISKPYME